MKKLVLSLVVALALMAGLSTSTFAADNGKGRPTSVYIVHGIPGVPVDVYVSDQLAIPNFQPGATAGPILFPIGAPLHVALRPAGAPADSAPILGGAINLGTTRAVSIVAHLSASGAPTVSTFFEYTDFGPPRGFGQVNVRHTAAFGAVDLWARAAGQGEYAKIASGLTNPNNLTLRLRAGEYDVKVVPAGAGIESAALTATIPVKTATTLNVYAIGNPTASPSTFGAVTQYVK